MPIDNAPKIDGIMSRLIAAGADVQLVGILETAQQRRTILEVSGFGTGKPFSMIVTELLPPFRPLGATGAPE